MLFTISQPAALLGLLVAFLLGLTLRVVAMRIAARMFGLEHGGRLRPSPREDIDPFGAVAAAIVGTGWGRTIDFDAMPRYVSKGRRASVIAAGPGATIVAGLAGLTAYRAFLPDERLALSVNNASTVLHGGYAPSFGGKLLLTVAVGLLCFGLLALIPLPPLDGFALLWLSLRKPSAGGEKVRYWLAENNIGVVILMIAVFFPLPSPFLHRILDLLALPFLWLWA